MQLTIKSGADAGKSVPVPNRGAELTIGRGAGNNLVLNDPKASTRHASIQVAPGGGVTLRDLGSSNGTFVNGQRVQTAALTGAEQIQIGDTLVALQPPPAANVAPVYAAGPAPPAPPPQGGPPTPPPPTGPQQPAPPGVPSSLPVSRPSRTYSAIQRVQVIKSTRRAMYAGIVVAVLVVVAIGLGLAGVYSGGGSDGPTVSDAVDEVRDGIVYVRVEDANSGSAGRGTAWVWNLDQGLLVTNQHVTAGAVTSIAVGKDGQFREVEIVGQAPCEDLALLRVKDTSGLKALEIGSQSELEIGTPVAAVGYPGGPGMSRDFDRFDLTGTDGAVSIVETSQSQFTNIIAVTAQINGGQSGGPLVTLDGKVVGVTSRTEFDDKFNIENGAIGIDRVKEIIPRLEAGEQVCSG